VRAILLAGLWAVLTVGGVAAVAAETEADTVPTTTRQITRAKLEALLGTYGKALGIRWSQNAKEPFNIVAFYDKDLRYTTRFEIVMSITRQNTIGIRAYSVPYLNIDEARDPSGLMRKMLRFSDQNFLFWGADASLDIFAGFTVTLESGFPEDAIKIVLQSIPLLDGDVGELEAFID
jgi:hypothetical protein